MKGHGCDVFWTDTGDSPIFEHRPISAQVPVADPDDTVRFTARIGTRPETRLLLSGLLMVNDRACPARWRAK